MMSLKRFISLWDAYTQLRLHLSCDERERHWRKTQCLFRPTHLWDFVSSRSVPISAENAHAVPVTMARDFPLSLAVVIRDRLIPSREPKFFPSHVVTFKGTVRCNQGQVGKEMRVLVDLLSGEDKGKNIVVALHEPPKQKGQHLAEWSSNSKLYHKPRQRKGFKPRFPLRDSPFLSYGDEMNKEFCRLLENTGRLSYSDEANFGKST